MKKRTSFELESELEAKDLLQDYIPSIKIASDNSSPSISSDNSSQQLFEKATFRKSNFSRRRVIVPLSSASVSPI
ncbi:hypothetical protein CsSME_00049651 [Camellia sinensis var. sinensis]